MKEETIIKTRTYESPCGILLLGSLGDRLCLCDWRTGRPRDDRVINRLTRLTDALTAEAPSAVTDRAARQLDEYFAGGRAAFGIPLLTAGTAFQEAVWLGLRRIPCGTTVTYGGLARALGCPAAVRAVANAVGANALSIFIPCHRVIGSDRSLTGYAGGLEAKRRLLALEGARREPALF